MQQKINNYNDIVFEWTPFNQFNDVRETGKGESVTVYLAIWKDGLLKYNIHEGKYTRKREEKVILKCLHNAQSIPIEFLNEVRDFFYKFYVCNFKKYLLTLLFY